MTSTRPGPAEKWRQACDDGMGSLIDISASLS